MRDAEELIRLLGLEPHPEGGHYREVYRSELVVSGGRLPRPRSALTFIYFLLERGEHSAWHRVGSDESWHFVAGAPLELLEVDPASGACRTMRVGPLAEEQEPLQIVRGGCWQAARSLGDFTLVHCGVAPGFELEDFRILTEADADWPVVARSHARAAAFLQPAAESRGR